MRYPLILTVACVVIHCTANPSAHGHDWLTLPSSYTHDVASGQRVSQFAPTATPTAPQPNNFRSSGYTHTRSTINYGQSSDNYHRVEEWGDPVRPYGEWRFPYRPYSTPYPNWGPPFGGLGGATGFGYGPGIYPPGQVGPRQGGQANPNPYPAGPRSPYPVAPYYDGYYPTYRE
jgi:hypothetical protein